MILAAIEVARGPGGAAERTQVLLAELDGTDVTGGECVEEGRRCFTVAERVGEIADLAAELRELQEGAGVLGLEGEVIGGVGRELLEERDRGRQELFAQLEVIAPLEARIGGEPGEEGAHGALGQLEGGERGPFGLLGAGQVLERRGVLFAEPHEGRGDLGLGGVRTSVLRGRLRTLLADLLSAEATGGDEGCACDGARPATDPGLTTLSRWLEARPRAWRRPRRRRHGR